MAFTVGTRLGPYEVVRSLGAGGMGEVYKGRDTRVDRSVAIKILPPSTSNDAEAEGRLEREARALASLSHPRICGLFEFTRLEGLQRGFRTDAAPWPHRTGELTWPRR